MRKRNTEERCSRIIINFAIAGIMGIACIGGIGSCSNSYIVSE